MSWCASSSSEYRGSATGTITNYSSEDYAMILIHSHQWTLLRSFLHSRREMLDDGVQIFAIVSPLLCALLRITFELFLLVFMVGFYFFSLLQLFTEAVLSYLLLLIHLPFKIVLMLLQLLLSKFVLIMLFTLQISQLGIPSLLKLFIVPYLLLFFILPFLNLVFKRLLVLLFKLSSVLLFFSCDIFLFFL